MQVSISNSLFLPQLGILCSLSLPGGKPARRRPRPISRKTGSPDPELHLDPLLLSVLSGDLVNQPLLIAVAGDGQAVAGSGLVWHSVVLAEGITLVIGLICCRLPASGPAGEVLSPAGKKRP